MKIPILQLIHVINYMSSSAEEEDPVYYDDLLHWYKHNNNKYTTQPQRAKSAYNVMHCLALLAFKWLC